jgi:hypothetical protein
LRTALYEGRAKAREPKVKSIRVEVSGGRGVREKYREVAERLVGGVGEISILFQGSSLIC